jgi:hypothetical protein
MASSRKPLRRINQNVPEDLYDRLAQTAVREDRTKSTIVVRALELYLSQSEEDSSRLRPPERGSKARGKRSAIADRNPVPRSPRDPSKKKPEGSDSSDMRWTDPTGD